MEPIQIAVIPKGSEQLRVELTEYKGAAMFSARCYYQDKAGDTRPGRNGINIKVELLPALAVALAEAALEANEQGLIKIGAGHAALFEAVQGLMLQRRREAPFPDDNPPVRTPQVAAIPGMTPLGVAVPDDYAEAMSNDLDPTDDPTKPGE
jgi:hypothetical protein